MAWGVYDYPEPREPVRRYEPICPLCGNVCSELFYSRGKHELKGCSCCLHQIWPNEARARLNNEGPEPRCPECLSESPAYYIRGRAGPVVGCDYCLFAEYAYDLVDDIPFRIV